MRHQGWLPSTTQSQLPEVLLLNSQEQERSAEQQPPDPCKEFLNAMEESARQLEEAWKKLELQTQDYWRCRHGDSFQRATTTIPQSHPLDTNPERLAMRLLRSLRNAEELKEQGTENERPADTSH